MIRRFTSIAVLAIASTTFAAAAFAAPVSLDIRVGPPAPRYERVPPPRAGYVWTPGYWDYRGNRHYWVGGTYVRARPGYVYSQPAWVNEGGAWRLNRGGWAHGDRDHDGVPNRFDSHPNNPNRR